MFLIEKCTFNNKFALKESKFKNDFRLINVSFNDDVSVEGSTIKEINLNEIFFKSLISIAFSNINIIDLKSINRNTFRKLNIF